MKEWIKRFARKSFAIIGTAILLAVVPGAAALATPADVGSNEGGCAAVNYEKQPGLQKICSDFGADGAPTSSQGYGGSLDDDPASGSLGGLVAESDSWFEAEYAWIAVAIGGLAGVGVALIRRHHHHPPMIS
jgi:hypothetical protein